MLWLVVFVVMVSKVCLYVSANTREKLRSYQCFLLLRSGDLLGETLLLRMCLLDLLDISCVQCKHNSSKRFAPNEKESLACDWQVLETQKQAEPSLIISSVTPVKM